MAAKTQISLAIIRVNDVKVYPSISLAIRFFTAYEIACGDCLAFHVCSGAYLIIKSFGNQANGSDLLALVFGFNIKPIHSAVDMGNQSTAACELFCLVCERLPIPIVRA